MSISLLRRHSTSSTKSAVNATRLSARAWRNTPTYLRSLNTDSQEGLLAEVDVR